MRNDYFSWGRYPKVAHKDVIKFFWLSDISNLERYEYPILPYGYGKSYGDSCLNENGTLLDCSGLNKFISFDNETGILRCEAGVTLSSILDFFVPRGWFLPVTPGTKFISVAGAVANDVHGKNHHIAGTFGCHITQFELLRSNGERLICSEKENQDFFKATIGGLGLTGFITWVEFKLKPCPSPFFIMDSIKFYNIDEFFEINEQSEKDFEYTVSWVDCTSAGSKTGRGIFNRGNHAHPDEHKLPKLPKFKTRDFPFDAPFINSFTVEIFNKLYFNKQFQNKETKLIHYDPFFYPLDAVLNWNKAYGKNGFLQYQFVIPMKDEKEVIKEIIKHITKSGLSSFLTVLKKFGNIKSPGMLSFPREGITMAVDFRFDGLKTIESLEELDEIVKSAGGIIYPAKDARMKGEDFRNFYPQYREFMKYIDPKFSSSFWRRVMS
jgi:FAD/FMN-containing dehydrogenase